MSYFLKIRCFFVIEVVGSKRGPSVWTSVKALTLMPPSGIHILFPVTVNITLRKLSSLSVLDRAGREAQIYTNIENNVTVCNFYRQFSKHLARKCIVHVAF